MKIAIIGSGISGLTCAYLLAQRHDVTLFERDDRLGGHTSTVEVDHEGRQLAVDTGFIVFNARNYPNFVRLLTKLGVASRSTTMSFSVRDDRSRFEYGGSSISGVIGPWTNLLRPRWWRVVRGVTSLGRQGKALLRELDETATIADLCASGRFSNAFLNDYLLPMASSIWSAPREALLDFPARFVLQFFDNHGMLDLRERPVWRTIVNGSKTYVEAMKKAIGPCVRLNSPVLAVHRSDRETVVQLEHGDEAFDALILACHSDQALSLLADPTQAERDVLGALPYQPNDVVLHTDPSALPTRQRCWAGWNYRVTGQVDRPVVVTYNMSILQGLDTRTPLCVTLNDTDSIDPDRIVARFRYDHPLSTLSGEAARDRWQEISGANRTLYCGAYWGNGFHEDGVVSALRVCKPLGGVL